MEIRVKGISRLKFGVNLKSEADQTSMVENPKQRRWVPGALHVNMSEWNTAPTQWKARAGEEGKILAQIMNSVQNSCTGSLSHPRLWMESLSQYALITYKELSLGCQPFAQRTGQCFLRKAHQLFLSFKRALIYMSGCSRITGHVNKVSCGKDKRKLYKIKK